MSPFSAPWWNNNPLRLIIASNNRHKRREIATILAATGIDIVPASETYFVTVMEDGETFAANAEKKAQAFAQANGCAALADDSGLMVDALGGAPGVRSSRYAGESATDADNNAKLLKAMQGVRQRGARFVCAVHMAFPDGRVPLTAEGHVDGRILEAPDGDGGFGYDPLFYCPELGKSFACASPAEKMAVSHRSRALRTLMKIPGLTKISL